uniref:Uncharacterized protein n=1 Tax=Lactuca sativa TaxID=4236 RepID=A0A9R1WE70_LACSA|nr:hypothetical protein LSAT_V11C200086970 [Lactuca sativa]
MSNSETEETKNWGLKTARLKVRDEILFIKILAKTEEVQKNTSKSIKNGNTIRPWYTWFRMSADSCFLHMRFIGLFALVDAPGMFYVAL